MTSPLDYGLMGVAIELERQNNKWGVQDWPDGTQSRPLDIALADEARQQCDEAASRGDVTWKHILTEEVMEAFAETDPEALVTELTQVAAVAVQWIGAINRRHQ